MTASSKVAVFTIVFAVAYAVLYVICTEINLPLAGGGRGAISGRCYQLFRAHKMAAAVVAGMGMARSDRGACRLGILPDAVFYPLEYRGASRRPRMGDVIRGELDEFPDSACW